MLHRTKIATGLISGAVGLFDGVLRPLASGAPFATEVYLARGAGGAAAARNEMICVTTVVSVRPMVPDAATL